MPSTLHTRTAAHHPPSNAVTAPAASASVWTLTVPPTIWALHFLACYVAAAVWCAKAGRAADLGNVRGWIVAFTLLALAALAAWGWRGLRRRRAASAAGGAAASTVADAGRLQQQRFLGGLTALLCALSMVAVVYAALVVALIGGCR